MNHTYPQVRAIVFDFDGVVVNSEPLYEAAETALFQRYGIRIPDEDWKYFKGLSEEKLFTFTKERYSITAPISELKVQGLELLKAEFAKHLDYMPGFLDFLDVIDGQYQTGLVTSSSRTLLEWIFRHTPVRNHFSQMIAAEDILQQKPHPEPYLRMAELLQLPPAEMLVIEDSINGVRSAKGAGAFTIGFLTTLSRADLQEADQHCANFLELQNFLFSGRK
jgi:HAD superfamily hydrolase (TIGR01509 family)